MILCFKTVYEGVPGRVVPQNIILGNIIAGVFSRD